jgi:hypothetical protein
MTISTRFRFSLRTLLIAMTVLSVLFGLEIHVVRQRKAALNWALENGASAIYSLNDQPILMTIDNEEVSGPSWFRRLIGDQEVVQIRLPESYPEDRAKLLSRLFPEAIVGKHYATDNKIHEHYY